MPDQEWRMHELVPIDGDNPSVIAFWSEVERMNVMRRGVPSWASKYTDVPVNEPDAFPRLRVTLIPNGGEWFARLENRADGSLNVNHAVVILREYLTRFDPKGARGLQWCWFGDECGGGACWVRADSVEYLYTDGWVADKSLGVPT